MSNVLYIAIQNTYTEVQLGLYKNNTCITECTLHKHLASSLLAQTIDELLTQHKVQLTDLKFFAVNQGPGPFTTLRVVIATINGLSFALGIPIIGINGIQALVSEYTPPKKQTVVALLNAFSQDVYFAIKPYAHPIASGAQNITTLLQHIKQTHSHASSIVFLGSGATMHADAIKKELPHATIESVLAHCSLDALAHTGITKWHKKEPTVQQLQPLYLKNIVYGALDISQAP